MTADELRETVAREMCRIEFDEAPFNMEDWWPTFSPMADAAIRVVIETAAGISESYEPRCDTCPRGVASAIRHLLPEEQQ